MYDLGALQTMLFLGDQLFFHGALELRLVSRQRVIKLCGRFQKWQLGCCRQFSSSHTTTSTTATMTKSKREEKKRKRKKETGCLASLVYFFCFHPSPLKLLLICGNFTDLSASTVVDASVVAVRTMAPKAREAPTVHRQHHLQATPFKVARHPPTLHQEFHPSPIPLLSPRPCQ